MKKIAILVGSLRQQSYSLMTANALKALAPSSIALDIVDIGHLPLYNQDFDAASPDSYDAFRKQIASYDGYIFVTPEHNRSFPAALKNALDVGSRPWGQNIWSGKPGGVVSTSIGGLGGFGANHHLRQVLAFLNVQVLQQPEAYISNTMAVFDSDGNVVDEGAKGSLSRFIEAYAAWVDKLS